MRVLERYLAGQHQQVWTELFGVGPQLREDQDGWAEARAIADVTMRRVLANIEFLRDQLPSIGYRFTNPDRVIVPPPAGIAGEIDRLEAEVGAVPLAFRAFWETVGTVDLSGTHPDWPHKLLDPLMFEASVDYYIDTRRDMIEQEILGAHDPFELDFAPDYLHKADISGGPPYAIQVPDASVDAIVIWEVHQTTFVNYLRTILHLGGMGGMSTTEHHGHESSPPPPELLALASGLESF